MSYQQSSGVFQGLKTTPLTEYFRAINLTFNLLFPLQCSCQEMKMLPWPIKQHQIAWKWKQWKTQIGNTCSLCWCKSSNNNSHDQFLRIRKGWKSLKKGWKVEKLEKRQPIFFKHILCKKSLGCSEKSLDHWVSVKITRSHEKSLGVTPMGSTHLGR